MPGSPTPSDVDPPTSGGVARPGSRRAFAPGFRLTAILEPDATVRVVTEAVGTAEFVREALIGSNALDAAERIGGRALREQWARRLATARTVSSPMRYSDRRSGLAEPAVITTVAPILNASGDVDAILVSGFDRSEQLREREAAHLERELLETAMDLSGLGRFVLHMRDDILEVDRRYAEIFGVDPSTMLAQNGAFAVLALVHDDDREHVVHDLDAALNGRPGFSYRSEYRIWVQMDGHRQLRSVAVLRRVEHDDAGPVRMVGVVDDITDRRAEEESRARLQKREVVGTLAAGLAHDFNNVLGAIVSNAHLALLELREEQDPSTSIRQIALAADEGGALVRRMLDASRDATPELRSLDLSALVREVCALMRPTIPASMRLIDDTPDHATMTLEADRSRLHQVLVNLIANASHAIGDAPGEIRVVVDVSPAPSSVAVREGTPRADWLTVTVRDDGSGIPEATLRRVFDPFFTTKPHGEGTGLGLAVALSIARAHGGDITITSVPGQGTTVTLYLPRTSTQKAGTAAPPEQGAGHGSIGATGPQDAPRPRVLFVDDEISLVEIAARAFPLLGCDVRAFDAPTTALRTFANSPEAFDLVITDHAMPTMTGLELVRRLREHRADLPAVLTTGYLDASIEAEATELGIDRIVPKPWVMATLIDEARRLAGAVRRSRPR